MTTTDGIAPTDSPLPPTVTRAAVSANGKNLMKCDQADTY